MGLGQVADSERAPIQLTPRSPKYDSLPRRRHRSLRMTLAWAEIVLERVRDGVYCVPQSLTCFTQRQAEFDLRLNAKPHRRTKYVE